MQYAAVSALWKETSQCTLYVDTFSFLCSTTLCLRARSAGTFIRLATHQRSPVYILAIFPLHILLMKNNHSTLRNMKGLQTSVGMSCGRFLFTTLAAFKMSSSCSCCSWSQQMLNVQNIPQRLYPSL